MEHANTEKLSLKICLVDINFKEKNVGTSKWYSLKETRLSTGQKILGPNADKASTTTLEKVFQKAMLQMRDIFEYQIQINLPNLIRTHLRTTTFPVTTSIFNLIFYHFSFFLPFQLQDIFYSYR
ncbi:hypothetical protein CEXT_474811 [Caerostris extrusa]|uniref:Uncharacterized protein n=1 Tax=Caerostris extrusa TaxID=172846 RepID=A0AAV4TC65_CAEEX|nr:hypothetical protein CEXT_474811 [Caerostris extrusa]